MLHDLRFALRTLRRAPGFTAIALLSLALGIGSATTVFCWLRDVIANPLPGVARQSEMAVFTTAHGNAVRHTVSLRDIADARELRDTFAGVIGSQITPACLQAGDEPQWIYGQVATTNFFEVLGVRALHGRTFAPADDLQVGGNAVLVLSERFWRKRFNGDPSVVGEVVQLNRHPFTIIGIVPAAFRGTMSGLSCDFWAPITEAGVVANYSRMDQRSNRSLHTQVRLQPGVSRARAQAALDAYSARAEQSYPDTNRELRFVVLPFAEAPYGVQPVLVPVLRVLFLVSIAVLLIVAVNLTGLLLARATVRQKEIAVRLSVGASRGQLIRQLLVESLVLTTGGGVLGALVAIWSVDLLVAWMPPTHLPVGLRFGIDWATFAFCAAVSLLTGVALGLVPALRASRPDLASTLKAGGRGMSGAPHQRLRQGLVAGQIALAMVLLVGAGLCLRSVDKAAAADFGLRPDRVLLAGLRVGMNGYTRETAPAFYQELRRRLAQLPGVESVGLASWFPLGFEDTGSSDVAVDGYTPQPGEDMLSRHAEVSPGYFETLRIPLLAGRTFTDQDDAAAARVVIVNEALARRFWPGQDAVGRVLRTQGEKLRVIGVVQTGRYLSLNEPPRPFFYRPALQCPWNLDLGLCVRAATPPAALAASIRAELRRLDPNVELWATLPMTEYMKAVFLAPMLGSRLLRYLGVAALALAALGVYGVMSFVVAQRTREFGVRLALGATTRTVRRMILREGLLLGAAGIAAGLVLAAAATRLMGAVLYGVEPFDPVVFALVPVLLGGVALGATWLPALRATRVDPVEALRSE